MNDSHGSAPRFSVIIPAYNDEACLLRLLDSVDTARIRYLGGPEGGEVVVVDNASTDPTADLALMRGRRQHNPPRDVQSN